MVVEQGFRWDLEAEPAFRPEHEGDSSGEFREMVMAQKQTGGFLPEKNPPPIDSSVDEEKVHALLDPEDDEDGEAAHPEPIFNMKHQSLARPALRPLTLGNWMFDVVADLTANKPASAMVVARDAKRVSRFVPTEAFTGSIREERTRRPSSIQVLPYSPDTSTVQLPHSAHTVTSRRYSLQFTPTSPTYSNWSMSRTSLGLLDRDEEEENFEREKGAVERSGSHAIGSRGKRVRKRWDDVKIPPLTTVKVDSRHKTPTPEDQPEDDFQSASFWRIVREIYPTIPYKPLLYLGLFTCLASGAMTPIFSFLLSRIQFEVSTGAKDVSTINFFGGIVLTVAALDGLLLGLKYFLMETAGNTWVHRIRKLAFGNVLAQDKKWFDKAENSGVGIVQTLVKDGDDARNLVAVVMGQACVVAAMVGVGLLWAMARGWQLTLVGIAVAPVFAGVMTLQAALVARCEIRNKRAREEVAKGYYDVCFSFPSTSGCRN
jgi:ATP-binding cassette subfamily B (MDR/TAP) protein 1